MHSNNLIPKVSQEIDFFSFFDYIGKCKNYKTEHYFH